MYGYHILILPDHNHLHFMCDTVLKSSKMVRWQLALQRYDKAIIHRRGSLNSNADALSHLF